MKFLSFFVAATLASSLGSSPPSLASSILIQREPALAYVSVRSPSNRPSPSNALGETGQNVWFGQDVRLTKVSWIGRYAELDYSGGPPWWFERPIDLAFPQVGDRLTFAVGFYPDDWNPRIPVHANPIREVTVEASYELLPEFSTPTYRFEALIPQPFVLQYSPIVTPYLTIVDTDPETTLAFFWHDSALDGWYRQSRRIFPHENWGTFGSDGGLAFTLYGEAIPEPSSFVGGCLASIGLAAFRRRK